MEKIEKIFVWIAGFAVLIGVFCVCANLDKKFCWYDERITLLRISGHTSAEMRDQHPYNSVFQIKDLDIYRQYNPGSSWKDTVRSLRSGEGAMHAPGYFLLARTWAMVFDSEIGTIRMLSVLFFFLCLPLSFFLIKLVSGSDKTALIFLSFFGTSPLFILYAQEARPYLLWTFLFILSWIALLRALAGSKSAQYWIGYAAALTAGLYVQPLMLLAAIGQGVYVLFNEKKDLKPFLLACLTALIAFSPWLIPQIADLTNISAGGGRWVLRSLRFNVWLTRIIINPGLTIFDPGWYSHQYPAQPLILMVYLFFCAAFLRLLGNCLRNQRQLGLFCFSVFFVPFLLLLGKDLLLGGQLATVPRYLLPFNIGLLCLIAYGLNRLSKKSVRGAIALYTLLILLSVFSCCKIRQSDFWWTKYSANFYSVQKALQQNKVQTLITNTSLIALLYLDYGLPQNTMVYLTPFDFQLPLDKLQDNIFLFTNNPIDYPQLRKSFFWDEIPLQKGIPSFGRLYRLIKTN